MDQIVYIQGSGLSLRRAHWIQILHTAHALAETSVEKLVLIPRTVSPEVLETLEHDLGHKLSPKITIRPLIDYDLYKRKGIVGNLLSKKQKFIFRRLGRKFLAEILKEELDPEKKTLVYTRDQEIPQVCQKVLKPWAPVLINEIHKFEYVNRLEAKIRKYSDRPRRLGWYRKFARREKKEEFTFLNQFDGVVCTTENMRQILAKKKLQSQTVAIPNGTLLPDDVNFTEAVNRERDIDILYVGQLMRWKNPDLVIQALKYLPDSNFHIVGGEKGGPDWNRLMDLAKKRGVLGRVIFHGQKPHHEVSDFMKRAMVGVVPLPQSGFPEARLFCCPLKAIELMAAGTPIVASDLKSVSGLLAAGENACLVKPDHPERLAEGIRKVLNDSEYANRLIKGGLEMARDLSYPKRAGFILEFANSLSSKK